MFEYVNIFVIDRAEYALRIRGKPLEAEFQTVLEAEHRHTAGEYAGRVLLTQTQIRARVKVGTPVYFVNNGRMPHTIVARDGTWTTGTLYSADSAAITFDKTGTYLYYTKDRPWAMGEVIVTGDTAAQPGGGTVMPIGNTSK